jgi:hypothetical protein
VRRVLERRPAMAGDESLPLHGLRVIVPDRIRRRRDIDPAVLDRTTVGSPSSPRLAGALMVGEQLCAVTTSDDRPGTPERTRIGPSRPVEPLLPLDGSESFNEPERRSAPVEIGERCRQPVVECDIELGPIVVPRRLDLHEPLRSRVDPVPSWPRCGSPAHFSSHSLLRTRHRILPFDL